VLDCFARGLAHAYREVSAPGGTTVCLEISGECGGRWYIAKEASLWKFVNCAADPAVRATVPQEIAWRLFTKGINREIARTQIKFEGDLDLGEPILQLTAIVG
jgi:hypothetical protein